MTKAGQEPSSPASNEHSIWSCTCQTGFSCGIFACNILIFPHGVEDPIQGCSHVRPVFCHGATHSLLSNIMAVISCMCLRNVLCIHMHVCVVCEYTCGRMCHAHAHELACAHISRWHIFHIRPGRRAAADEWGWDGV